MTVLTRDYLGVATDEDALKVIADVLGQPVGPLRVRASRERGPVEPGLEAVHKVLRLPDPGDERRPFVATGTKSYDAETRTITSPLADRGAVVRGLAYYVDAELLPAVTGVEEAQEHLREYAPEAFPSAVALAVATRLMEEPGEHDVRDAVADFCAHALAALGDKAAEVPLPEVFACAFEQWVALRSGDEALAGVRHWEPDTFGPVAKALDRLFAAAGWLP